MKKLDKKEIRFEELGNVVGGTTVGPVNETGPLNYPYKQNTGPLNYPYKHNTGPLPLGTCDPPC